MSTRCNVIVEDRYDRIQLYRHSDGYPEGPHGVVETLKEAIPFAWSLPRFEASDFSAAIVRAWKKYGGHIYIDGSTSPSKPWALVHGDAEWVYIVKMEAEELRVHVYDWHKYGFGRGDPSKDVPVADSVTVLWSGK